ncbi:hypothetical protein E4T82_07275 [Streptococcus cuniculi]|uniref:Uncharacterized protein n=2 Tax=Streptococcus cuniculi TaxID=1432788 RepID=A0A4Y9JC21_9STRE|nr:hypothetical protein [Streptococcus cuniculi]MBF0778523.1 hypothetical protein [Streptococcus cuniculi]TFU97616.1 hypothetical protein E4T82_07275 [Streptococcus cuniculi]
MKMKKMLQLFSALVFGGNLCLVVYGFLDRIETIPVFWALIWSFLMISYIILVIVYYLYHLRHRIKSCNQ